jgi:hypothetical protein
MGVEFGPGSLAGALGLLGVGIAMIFPDNKWIGGIFILAAIVVLFFDIKISGWEFSAHAPSARGKPFALWGMVAFGIGFVGCAGWYFWPIQSSKTVRQTSSSLDQTISLECYWSRLPTTMPEYSLYYWEFAGGDDPIAGLLSTSGTSGAPLKFDFSKPENGPDHFNECKAVNYGHDPIIRFQANFQILFRKAVPNANGNGTSSGEVIKSIDMPNPPLRLGTGDKNNFSFYMRNRTPYWITIVVPTVASVQLVGSDTLQEVRLIEPSTPDRGYPYLPPWTPPAPSTTPPAPPHQDQAQQGKPKTK